ncbi:MAG: hypothetical protein ABSA52_21765 [Candidatus Binatia bacterium]|jgi:hypothetical protein
MSTRTEDGNRPPGRPPKHYARWLARRLKENGLDGRTGPAKLLKMRADELADDAGGWPNLSNRECVLVQRTAALILLCETIEGHVFSQTTPFTDSGELLAVLSKNYIAYSNTVRLNLLALGLKPDKAPRVPTLEEYLAAKAGGGNGTPGSAGGPQSHERATVQAEAPAGGEGTA